MSEEQKVNAQQSCHELPDVFKYNPGMLKCSEVSGLDLIEVYQWIIDVPHSAYYQWTIPDVANLLGKSDAYRYLNKLILLNERNFSLLSQVKEDENESSCSNSSLPVNSDSEKEELI